MQELDPKRPWDAAEQRAVAEEIATYKAALTEIRSFVCVPVEASPDPEVDDMASVLNAGSVISMVLIARQALTGEYKRE